MRTRALMIRLTCACALLLTFIAPAAAEAKSCGSFKIGDYRAYVTVERGPTGCKTAKRLVLDLYKGKGTPRGTPPNDYRALRGWRCDTATGGGACGKRGRNYKTYKDYVTAEIR